MSRNIKFRAWDKIGECWLQSRLIQDFLTIGVPEDPKDGIFTIHDYKTNRIEIMQYTGLKDKNGKECFESDLIEAKGNRIFEVIWNKDRWGMEDHGGSYDIPKDFEIVGNIYESNRAE